MANDFRVVVKGNVAEFIGSLEATHKQVVFAEMVALNRTARDAREAVRDEMKRVFDRPTRWSLNAFQIETATRSRLVATVVQKYAAGGRAPRTWFNPNVYGEARRAKAFENALASRLGLPIGSTFFMPGSGAKLDRYGNVSGGQLGQVLSDLGARQTDPNQNATDRSRKRNKRARHFVLQSRNGSVNIVVKTSKGLSVVFTAVSSAPDYAAIFQFHKVVERSAMKRYPIRFEEAFNQAVASAR